MAAPYQLHIGKIDLPNNIYVIIDRKVKNGNHIYGFVKYHESSEYNSAIMVAIYNASDSLPEILDYRIEPATRYFLHKQAANSALHDSLLAIKKNNQLDSYSKYTTIETRDHLIVTANMTGNFNDYKVTGTLATYVHEQYIISIYLYEPIDLPNQEKMSFDTVLKMIQLPPVNRRMRQYPNPIKKDDINPLDFVICTGYYFYMTLGTKNNDYDHISEFFYDKIHKQYPYTFMKSELTKSMDKIDREIEGNFTKGAINIINKYEAKCQKLAQATFYQLPIPKIKN